MPIDSRIPLTVQSPQFDSLPLVQSMMAIQRAKREDADRVAKQKREDQMRAAAAGAIDPTTGRPDFQKMAVAFATLDPEAATRAYQAFTAQQKEKLEEERKTFRIVAGLTQGILDAPEADRPRRYATARSLALTRQWATTDELQEVYDEVKVRDIHALATRATETADDIEHRIALQKAEEAARAAQAREAADAAKAEAQAKKDDAAAERDRQRLALEERRVKVAERDAHKSAQEDVVDKVALREAERWRSTRLADLEALRRAGPVDPQTREPRPPIGLEVYQRERATIERLYGDMIRQPETSSARAERQKKQSLPSEKRASGRKVGDQVTLKDGRRVTITAVNPDGTYRVTQ